MIELTLSLHHMPAKRLILVSSDNWRKSSKNEPGALPFALVCRTNALTPEEAHLRDCLKFQTFLSNLRCILLGA